MSRIATASWAAASALLLVLVCTVAAQQEYTYVHAKNTCSMYRECSNSSQIGIPGTFNCPYNGPSFIVRAAGSHSHPFC